MQIEGISTRARQWHQTKGREIEQHQTSEEALSLHLSDS